VYTDKRGRKTFYPIDVPKSRSSPAQAAFRERFRLAQAAWAALTSDEKQLLEDATRRTSVPLTGQNLYISVALRGNQSAADAIFRQAGLPSLEIPYVPS